MKKGRGKRRSRGYSKIIGNLGIYYVHLRSSSKHSSPIQLSLKHRLRFGLINGKMVME
ncbi:hypothetical protein HPP92_019864 [Vanilla planifolia]|uniref:Uncharacterized protein n=1 Tax=Vanilla planifolia TaxID=51239 RepID=A0A835UK85_VANPL|nr:hypothetical protein HPP92_019864 [Vanilla planifolia]